jgi:hypothetical protein
MRLNSKKYPVKVIIEDGSNSITRGTLIVNVVNGVPTLDNILYPYNQTFSDSFFNTAPYSGRPVSTYYQDDYLAFKQTYLTYPSVSIIERAYGFAAY